MVAVFQDGKNNNLSLRWELTFFIITQISSNMATVSRGCQRAFLPGMATVCWVVPYFLWHHPPSPPPPPPTCGNPSLIPQFVGTLIRRVHNLLAPLKIIQSLEILPSFFVRKALPRVTKLANLREGSISQININSLASCRRLLTFHLTLQCYTTNEVHYSLYREGQLALALYRKENNIGKFADQRNHASASEQIKLAFLHGCLCFLLSCPNFALHPPSS